MNIRIVRPDSFVRLESSHIGDQRKKRKKNKMKNALFLALVFGLTFAVADRAYAQTPGKARVVNGSCTPKVGDDLEVSIHTPQNTDGSIGQIKGVKYILLTIIQGGKREGTSIKGGTRTTCMQDADQKGLADMLEAAGYKGKGGAKLGLCKITAVSGPFQLQKGDEVGGKGSTAEVFRKGKSVGTFTFKVG